MSKKTIECHKCGMVIPESADICHYCGAKQPDMISKLVAKLIILGIKVFIILVIAVVSYLFFTGQL